MKGLIIKDLCVLKNQMKTLLLVLAFFIIRGPFRLVTRTAPPAAGFTPRVFLTWAFFRPPHVRESVGMRGFSAPPRISQN